MTKEVFRNYFIVFVLLELSGFAALAGASEALWTDSTFYNSGYKTTTQMMSGKELVYKSPGKSKERQALPSANMKTYISELETLFPADSEIYFNQDTPLDSQVAKFSIDLTRPVDRSQLHFFCEIVTLADSYQSSYIPAGRRVFVKDILLLQKDPYKEPWVFRIVVRFTDPSIKFLACEYRQERKNGYLDYDNRVWHVSVDQFIKYLPTELSSKTLDALPFRKK